MKHALIPLACALLPALAAAQSTYDVTFVATRGLNGPADPHMLWDIHHDDRIVVDGSIDTRTETLRFQTAPETIALEPGHYTVWAYGVAEDVSASAQFVVTDAPLTVTLLLPAE